MIDFDVCATRCDTFRTHHECRWDRRDFGFQHGFGKVERSCPPQASPQSLASFGRTRQFALIWHHARRIIISPVFRGREFGSDHSNRERSPEER